jgi:hypothetical protein
MKLWIPISLIALLLGVTACSARESSGMPQTSTPPSSPQSLTSPSPTQKSSSPLPSSTVQPSVPESTQERFSWTIPSFNVTTVDGYTASFSNLSIQYSTSPTIDIANAKPGKALIIDGKVALSGSLKNTTSGRTFKGAYVWIEGYQRVTSTQACKGASSNGDLFKTSSGSMWCRVASMSTEIKSSDAGDMVLDVGAIVSVGGQEWPMRSLLDGEVSEAAANETIAKILATPIVWVAFDTHRETPCYKEATQLPAKEWWYSDSWNEPNASNKSNDGWILAKSGTL